MNKLRRFLPALPATIFIFMGVRWLVNPEAAAQAQLMPLLEGMALSSQIADIGALVSGHYFHAANHRVHAHHCLVIS